MTRYVVDASVAVEYLLRTPLGESVANIIDSAKLLAPALIDAEVLSALRREVLRGHLGETQARLVIDVLRHWPVERMSHRDLAPVAWRYYRTVSAYDAFYVAAAQTQDCPLITADGPLSRAPGLDVVVHHVHIGQSGWWAEWN